MGQDNADIQVLEGIAVVCIPLKGAGPPFLFSGVNLFVLKAVFVVFRFLGGEEEYPVPVQNALCRRYDGGRVRTPLGAVFPVAFKGGQQKTALRLGKASFLKMAAPFPCAAVLPNQGGIFQTQLSVLQVQLFPLIRFIVEFDEMVAADFSAQRMGSQNAVRQQKHSAAVQFVSLPDAVALAISLFGQNPPADRRAVRAVQGAEPDVLESPFPVKAGDRAISRTNRRDLFETIQHFDPPLQCFMTPLPDKGLGSAKGKIRHGKPPPRRYSMRGRRHAPGQ